MDRLYKAIRVEGVGTGYGTSECYNTGKITVKLTSGTACVGGVSYAGTKLKNCYNTGAVSLTGNGQIGGIAAEFYSGYSNYNTGKISGKGKTLYKGEIAGNAGYSYLDGVTVYDNYYTGSGKKKRIGEHILETISVQSQKSIFDHIRKLLEAFFQILDILKQT